LESPDTFRLSYIWAAKLHWEYPMEHCRASLTGAATESSVALTPEISFWNSLLCLLASVRVLSFPSTAAFARISASEASRESAFFTSEIFLLMSRNYCRAY